MCQIYNEKKIKKRMVIPGLGNYKIVNVHFLIKPKYTVGKEKK